MTFSADVNDLTKLPRSAPVRPKTNSPLNTFELTPTQVTCSEM